MNNNFNTILQEYFGNLNPEELTILLSYFREETLCKDDFFTKTDSFCNRLSLVKSGLLRIYTFSDGKEITQWISTPNYFVTEISSFFFNQPNRWNIQALTDVKLLTLTKESYTQLCKDFPKWNDIEKQFIAKCFAMLENRVFSHLSMTAEERYQLFFEQNKVLFNEVPLQYIASILGMTPETLSRIRKRQLSNS
ncbi:Crp/Fnr family transcriptional regulator [Tenacibaculum tangerinum]|uniref:Crp/Fnr family transcriptional regulator n=1 Tax=Tenacibaculum tangerinum TaxID=3038772 RepID=A0ABY8L1Y2_9FLAO|nr:Crp/Fnr family transcriptional regulator [Tenacibaculum tangerinum]WGH75462.1 Crp/Fnr family transcriptional regulator [Tenacibaculum tangerinum]